MKVTEVYTVEYSVVQRCYHIDTLTDSIRKNRELVRKGEYNGFVIVHVCASPEEAQAYIYGEKQEDAAHAVALALKGGIIN